MAQKIMQGWAPDAAVATPVRAWGSNRAERILDS
jgi:hypothetical protein